MRKLLLGLVLSGLAVVALACNDSPTEVVYPPKGVSCVVLYDQVYTDSIYVGERKDSLEVIVDTVAVVYPADLRCPINRISK